MQIELIRLTWQVPVFLMVIEEQDKNRFQLRKESEPKAKQFFCFNYFVIYSVTRFLIKWLRQIGIWQRSVIDD